MSSLGMPLGMWAVFSKLLYFRLIPHFVQIPTQKIRILPTNETLSSTASVMKP